jgi:hypothetical protein
MAIFTFSRAAQRSSWRMSAAVHLHHDAALAGQVAAQRAAPGRGQQRMR